MTVEEDAANDRLGAAMRALADAVVRSGADASAVEAATASVLDAHARLTSAPQRMRLHDSPFHPMSIVGGTAHPIAPQLHVRADGDGVTGTVVLGAAYEGGPGLVHGGVLSLMIDHAMGQALYVAGHAAMTVSLEVRYTAPTPLDAELTLTAALERREGRKLFVTASVRAGESVTVEARGVFVALTLDNVTAIFPAGRIPRI